MTLNIEHINALRNVRAGNVIRKAPPRGVPQYRVKGFLGKVDQAPYEYLTAEAYLTLEEEPEVLLTGKGIAYLEAVDGSVA
jgi:hypothetical protein